MQWESAQPSADRYDFTDLHRQLEAVATLGRYTTVQLNANRQPEWLFNKVPYYQKPLTKEQDKRGTLQYWHPAYVKLYTGLIAAFAREVKSSPYHSRIIGVRLNYDVIGTEFLIVPPDQRDPSKWTAPPGETPGPPWTEEISEAYRKTVVDTFFRNFSPEIRVLLRTGNPQYKSADPDILRLAGTGNVGFFTTAMRDRAAHAHHVRGRQVRLPPRTHAGAVRSTARHLSRSRSRDIHSPRRPDLPTETDRLRPLEDRRIRDPARRARLDCNRMRHRSHLHMLEVAR